jgi:hypothetical protein
MDGILGKGNELSQDVYLVKSPFEMGQTTTTHHIMSGAPFAPPSKEDLLCLDSPVVHNTSSSVFNIFCCCYCGT